MEKKEDKFLNVLEEYKRIIYKITNAYCSNVEDRRDLIQEIIIQLWNSFDRYDPKYKFSTWMYRISLNTAISFYRRNKTRSESISELSEAIHNTIEAREAYTQDPKVKMLHRFIGELKEIDKAIMLLYLDGLSQKQIAEVVGITATNAGSKISRIKKILKNKFDKINNYE